MLVCSVKIAMRIVQVAIMAVSVMMLLGIVSVHLDLVEYIVKDVSFHDKQGKKKKKQE